MYKQVKQKHLSGFKESKIQKALILPYIRLYFIIIAKDALINRPVTRFSIAHSQIYPTKHTNRQPDTCCLIS